jgi:hypothetical protein
MAIIDAGKLLGDMGTAAANAAGANWGTVRDYAETELQKLAATAAQIALQKTRGTITEDEAATLVEMQKNASRAVLLGIEGVGLLLAEEIINAALGVLKGAINAATGFKLI